MVAIVFRFGHRPKNNGGMQRSFLLINVLMDGQLYDHLWVDQTRALAHVEINEMIEFNAIGCTYSYPSGIRSIKVKRVRNVRVLGYVEGGLGKGKWAKRKGVRGM